MPLYNSLLTQESGLAAAARAHLCRKQREVYLYAWHVFVDTSKLVSRMQHQSSHSCRHDDPCDVRQELQFLPLLVIVIHCVRQTLHSFAPSQPPYMKSSHAYTSCMVLLHKS